MVSLYVDGNLIESQGIANSGDYTSSQAFSVGAAANGAGDFGSALNGYVDEVRLSNVALDPSKFLNAPSAAVPGDFDGDGDVDGADFVAWQTHFPTGSGAALADGDADGDGDVDGADFVVWQTNFPFIPGPGASAVPEPSSFAVLLSLDLLALTLSWKLKMRAVA